MPYTKDKTPVCINAATPSEQFLQSRFSIIIASKEENAMSLFQVVCYAVRQNAWQRENEKLVIEEYQEKESHGNGASRVMLRKEKTLHRRFGTM